LIIFSQKYQKIKTATTVDYLVMSMIPLLLMGIVTKRKLSTIFTKLSTSTKIVKCRTEADFLFFGMQQNNKEKLLEDPFLHMLGMHDL